jgi:hypothetical protein
MEKVCPIRQAKPDKAGTPKNAKCIKGKCAWFVDDDCALTLIARHLTGRTKGEGFVQF